jgi:hypothetical protein
VIRCAGELAAVLEYDGYALALALHHHLALTRDCESSILGRPEDLQASGSGHPFDPPTGTVGKQDRRTGADASRTSIAHQIEPHRREVFEHSGLLQVVGDDA